MCFGPFVPWNMGTALHFGRDLAIIALPLWWSHLKPRNYALLATAAKRRSRFANASLVIPTIHSPPGYCSSSLKIKYVLNKQSRYVRSSFALFTLQWVDVKPLPKRNEFIYKRRIITVENLNIGRNNSVNLIQIPGIVCSLGWRESPPLSWDGWFRRIQHPEKCGSSPCLPGKLGGDLTRNLTRGGTTTKVWDVRLKYCTRGRS